jgi:hypothetical protein
VRRFARAPWLVLGPLVLAQWAAVGVFVLVVRHNGWLFYQGGDETFFYTDSWAIAHARIPESEIGYAWSYLTSPIALFAGPSYLAALPAIVLLQVIVLLPLALYCVYAITARIGGVRLGYLAAALWVSVPFALIPLFDQRYHAKYVEQFLPQALGLTGLGDFPSMVCLLVAALFCLRALDGRRPLDACAAGLAAGFAIGIKPANVLFLAGPALAFLAARRLRLGLGFALALLPSLAALALWKYRGLGRLPIVTPRATASALGGAEPLATAPSHYVRLDWSRLGDNYVQLREFLPTTPLLQSLPLAGLLGALLRAFPKALLLGGWIGAFLVVKGSSDQANVEGGTLFRLLLPGFPPLLIFVALVPLLLPWLWERIARDARPALRAVSPRALAGAALVFGVVPAVLFLAFPPLHGRSVVKYFNENVMVPVDPSFTASVRPRGRARVVTWRRQPTRGVAAFYRVFRVRPVQPAPDPTLPPGRDGIRCLAFAPSSRDRASDCRLEMQVVGVTRAGRLVDRPPHGSWVYRVGLLANWLDDSSLGDVFALSEAARSRAP